MGKAKKIVIYLGIVVLSLILIVSITRELIYYLPTYFTNNLPEQKLITTAISSIFSYGVSLIILSIPYYILILSFIYLFLNLRSDFHDKKCNYGLLFISFLVCYIISIVVEDFNVSCIRCINNFLLIVSTSISGALYIALVLLSHEKWKTNNDKRTYDRENSIYRIHISKNKTKFKILKTSIIDWQTTKKNKHISNSIFILTGITVYATMDEVIKEGVFLPIRELFLITAFLIGNIVAFIIVNMISNNMVYEKWFYFNEYKTINVSDEEFKNYENKLDKSEGKELKTIVESAQTIKESAQRLNSKI